MNKKIFITAITILLSSVLFAQNDTLYFMKDGQIAGKYNVLTQIDSIIFYKPDIVEPPTQYTFVDERDGTEYTYVVIGQQSWMSQNLRYLPEVSSPSTGSLTDPHYYVYGYYGTDVEAAKNTENYHTYGVLYNWEAAMNGQESNEDNPVAVQGVCPTGWHLPNNEEWMQLINYSGGMINAGGKLKEEGTEHWEAPNAGATNETGFTAVAAGFRSTSGTFSGLLINNFLWTSTSADDSKAWYVAIFAVMPQIDNYVYNKNSGFTVRCVKN